MQRAEQMWGQNGGNQIQHLDGKYTTVFTWVGPFTGELNNVIVKLNEAFFNTNEAKLFRVKEKKR